MMKDSEVIKLNREFSAVCRRGQKYNGKYISLFVYRNRLGKKRIGVTCSRKFPNAVSRNRAKRILREAYRSVEAELKAGKDVVLLMKSMDEPGLAEIQNDLRNLLFQANLLEADA